MKTFKRISAFVLCLMMALSCGSMAFAAEVNTVSLETVFEEAKAEYQIAPMADTVEAKEMVYEEIELEDGSKLIVEGYPTEHMVSGTVVEVGEETENYVYSLTRATLTNQDEFSGKWGYMLSTIKYLKSSRTQEGVQVTTKKIDSFSYDMDLNSGYTMSTMKIRYYSIDNDTGLNVDKTITTSQLVMTNYPTTSLGYVGDRAASGGFFGTGVQYNPVINGTTYFFPHVLIG